LSTHFQELKQADLRFMYEDIQQRRAFLLVTLTRFQDAVPVLEEILAFDLDRDLRSTALASLGLCYLEMKNYKSARDKFIEAIGLGLGNEWKGRAHFYLGVAYSYTDQVDEAKQQFQIAEQLAVSHQLPILDIYAWLSSTCKRLGENSESARYATLVKRV
jgi:tetratricopeptide (TPR) repeat protein